MLYSFKEKGLYGFYAGLIMCLFHWVSLLMPHPTLAAIIFSVGLMAITVYHYPLYTSYTENTYVGDILFSCLGNMSAACLIAIIFRIININIASSYEYITYISHQPVLDLFFQAFAAGIMLSIMVFDDEDVLITAIAIAFIVVFQLPNGIQYILHGIIAKYFSCWRFLLIFIGNCIGSYVMYNLMYIDDLEGFEEP